MAADREHTQLPQKLCEKFFNLSCHTSSFNCVGEGFRSKVVGTNAGTKLSCRLGTLFRSPTTVGLVQYAPGSHGLDTVPVSHYASGLSKALLQV